MVKNISKYPESGKSVATVLDQTLTDLHVSSVYGYLLHHFRVYQNNPEIWKEVMFALRKVKGRRGNRKVVQSLDDILAGDKVHIKQGIRLFLEENTEDISLAYLLKALIKADRIKASTRYMTFHRAIEQFSQRHYGHDIPQKRYGEIKDMTLNSPQRGSSYTKAKRIIDRWSEYFINNG